MPCNDDDDSGLDSAWTASKGSNTQHALLVGRYVAHGVDQPQDKVFCTERPKSELTTCLPL